MEVPPGGAVRSLVDRLSPVAPAVVDLTDPAHEHWTVQAAETLAGTVPLARDLAELDQSVAHEGLPVALGLALKLAPSRRLLRETRQPVHLSVVLAVYREHERILPAGEHLRVHVRRPGSIRKVPVAWIDSDALSTTADLEPYLDMLQMVARFLRAYLPADDVGESFAGLIEMLDKAAFDTFLEAIPPQIAESEPMAFDDLAEVGAAEMARRAGLAG